MRFFACMYVCSMYTMCVPCHGGQKIVPYPLGSGVTDSYEPSCKSRYQTRVLILTSDLNH